VRLCLSISPQPLRPLRAAFSDAIAPVPHTILAPRFHFQQDIEDLGSGTDDEALSAPDAKLMAQKLVEWYNANKRDLPWRHQVYNES